MPPRRKPSELRDGTAAGAVGERYKYTCRLCGNTFFDAVPPDLMEDATCHRCFTGAQHGPRGVYVRVSDREGE